MQHALRQRWRRMNRQENELMLGQIFQHLESFVSNHCEPEVWNAVVQLSGVSVTGGFEAMAQYPDADLHALVLALSTEADWTVPDTWRRFGKFSTSGFIQKYPSLIAKYANAQDLMHALNDMHYVEVKGIFPNATLPYFYQQKASDGALTTRYYSRRKLCFYFEGGLESLGEFYKTPIGYKQLQCQHQGAELCEFAITFG